jgi:hypothetical protein
MVNFGTVAAVMHAWSLYIKAVSRALETNPQKCVTFLRLPKVFPRQYGVVCIIAFIELHLYLFYFIDCSVLLKRSVLAKY